MSGLMNVRGVVIALLNRTISPYVDNLNPDDLNLAVMAGDLTLHNLHLKKSAVEKYNLPIEVVEGNIGHLHVTIPWLSFRTQPITITIEDVFLLVKMKEETDVSDTTAVLAQDEKRAQEAKQEKLRNAENIDLAAAAGNGAGKGASDEEKQTWLGAFTSKLVDNVQISIKNIHVRYEDNLSTPDHPFAAGFTLSSFKAVSTDADWVEAFIQNSLEGVRKLATLDGLALYFDTDAKSIYRGQGTQKRHEMKEDAKAMISTREDTVPHQYILKPVSGEARVKLKKKYSKEAAKTEAEVIFDEIGFVLDDDQYRDALSMLDLFHFYTRTHQYRRYRPPDQAFQDNLPKARWKFATNAIRSEIHDKHKRWSWSYFAERRDNRNAYVEIYCKTLPGNKPLGPEDAAVLEKLELELSYEDIRFFRSVARARARKDAEVRHKLEEDKKAKQAKAGGGGWLGWVWGGSASTEASTDSDEPQITDADRKQLNEIIDYDASAAIDSTDLPKDFMLTKITTTLRKGSLALKSGPQGRNAEIISLVFDTFGAGITQYTDSMDANMSLGDFRVYDGTMPNTLYQQIVRVKSSAANGTADADTDMAAAGRSDPFLTVRFEHNPLDGRADNAMAVKMRHLEIIYHRGYVDAIIKFFRPPASQLESIGALLDAAGQTLDDIRRETRAGLEYALEQHKTIDMQVDMNAPIIIIPEDPTTKDCLHLVLDAGHIAVSSTLADKEAMQKIQAKRGQRYNDRDFQNLEALMYDRFSLRLESTQLLIGNDLDQCIGALEHEDTSGAELHIVERINMNFTIQNAILNVPNLTRFKISGELPHLQLNFSDAKYKSLMRIIDIAVPSSDDDHAADVKRPPPQTIKSSTFRSRPVIEEYTLQDDDETVVEADEQDVDDEKEHEEFFEADDTTTEMQRLDVMQKSFEFAFSVGQLTTSLFKSNADGREEPFANATLDEFGMNFAMRRYDMSVDVFLRSLSLSMLRKGKAAMPILTSDEGLSVPVGDIHELLRVRWEKVQKDSPNFMTVHEGVDQSITVQLSTVNIMVSPRPILSLYDFIMTTFVPANKEAQSPAASVESLEGTAASTVGPPANSDKLRIRVKLTAIRLYLQDEIQTFATLALTSADVALLMRGGTMRLSASLGNLSLVEGSATEKVPKGHADLLTIEGEDLADFSYETFDSSDQETFPGYDSAVNLRAGSLRFTLLEEPLHQVLAFATEFAQLKAVYDAASQAAIDRAPEVTRMKYDIAIKTPIVDLPRDGMQSAERLVFRLGEITAKNAFSSRNKGDTTIHAGLSGINAVSEDTRDASRQLQLMDSVNIEVEVWQPAADSTDAQQITGKTNDIKLALTEKQYSILMDLAKVVPRAFTTPSQDLAVAGQEMVVDTPKGTTTATVSPDATTDAKTKQQGSQSVARGLKFAFKIPSVNLELFDGEAVSSTSLQNHSIAKFRLNEARMTYRSKADASSEMEVSLRSITMSNTRTGSSIFREIIPPAEHDGNQFMLQYTVTGGPDPSALALITVDSPRVIFAVDPLFALMDFAMSPFKSDTSPDHDEVETDDDLLPTKLDKVHDMDQKPSMPFAYRVEVVQATVMVLASDSDPRSQAIQLSIKNVVMAQQSKTTLVVHELGMSFGRMDAPNDQVRFLDDVDITLALDAAKEAGHMQTNIELTTQPIVFRASFSDILLITDVVNKAIALSARSAGQPDAESGPSSPKTKRSDSVVAQRSQGHSRRASRSLAGQSRQVAQTQVLTSRENLKATCEGFQLVLVGDVHDLPVLHLSTKAFEISASDWSADLKMATALSTAINYYNLTNSHWEPLMDPWEFGLKIGRKAISAEAATTSISISSKKRLELNATSNFIEMAITASTMWSKQTGEARRADHGTAAPFVVCNRTGYSLLIWSDSDRKANAKPVSVKRLGDGESIPWRFEDHKRLRENIASSSHNAFGVQVENMPWERLRNLSVDREGNFTHTLRPRLEEVSHRLVCDVKVKDNIKIVTLRSTMKIENHTHLPMELILLDSANKPSGNVFKIPPGEDCPLPIEAAYHQRFKLRPDRGFDHAWSERSLSWKELIKRPVRTITCPHRQADQAPFMFQAATLYDRKDPLIRRYPRLTLRIRAPLEIENLLPYNIRYRVYDKNTRKSTTNFCIRGGSSPVHTVELDHLLLLSVEAQDSGFKQSEFAIINTDNPDDFKTEDVLVVADKRDMKLNLKIHYFTYPDAGGAFKVQIYSPYVIINKTGLPFNIASKTWSGTQKAVAGYDMFLDDYKQPEPTPFMFNFPHEERNNRLFLRVADTEWSNPFSIEGVSADSEVVLTTRDDKYIYHVGLSYAEGLGKYKLCKVITLTPRFLIRNESSYTLNFRQYRRDSQSSGPVPAGKRFAMTKLSQASTEQISIAIHHPSLVKWSAPVNLAEMGRVHVRVQDPSSDRGKDILFKVDTLIEGSSIFHFVSEETARWPLQIRNETTLTFGFQQTEDDNSQGIAQDRIVKKLRPHETAEYAWDSPAATGKRLRLVTQETERIIDVMEIGVLSPFKFKVADREGRRRSATVSLDVKAEGNSQVLIISPYNEETSVYKPRRPGGGITRTDSVDSMNVMSFDAVEVSEKPNMTFKLDFEGIGISVVSKHLQELVYVSFRGLNISYTDYPQHYDASLDCKWIQVDNQLFGGLFPIVLYPTVVPKDGKELDSHPTLQLSMTMLKDSDHGVTYFKYATMLLQTMTIELDEDFLFALLDFSKFEGASWKDAPQDVLIEHPVEIPEPKATSAAPTLYFENLFLQPMQLELSFMRTDRVNVDEKLSTRNPMIFFINALTMALGNVNAAPVRLNSLLVHNARLSSEALTTRVVLHYREQFVSQLYRVLGSADFLGNPVGLFNNVSSGVQDIFYEPYQGLVMHGNKELGIGIARGATSFAKKTIFGVTDSMTKVTGSIGKGLSAATLDSDYQTRRRMAQRRNKPRHALYGVTVGANAFASSVASGFEGLALKPLEGAEAGGVGGFFKGVGKGFVGAVTKPVVGVFDFASNVTEGIRNTTTVFDQAELDRVRLPRFISSDGILRPFSNREALGQSWLKDLENGKYFHETYVAHLDLTGDDSVIMLTTSRILLIRSTKLRVVWEVPFDDLKTISLEPSGMQLVLSGDVGGPFLPLPEQSQRMFLFKHVETWVRCGRLPAELMKSGHSVVKKHNEAKKSAEV